MEKEIIYLEPIFKQCIWGGENLKEEWGYDVPGEKVGECWAVAAHKSGDCGIKNEKYKDYTLTSLWEKKPELFDNKNADGTLKEDRFPLLTKIIDAADDLSIQVHPNDEYAMKNENGSLGKTECWYVLKAPEGAKLVVGHNATTRDELKAMIDEGRWSELIREVPVKAGDFIQINPGTVHAIKGGLQILETQQSSDITYRLYDYDRLQNGKPRDLHLKQSIDVITVPAASAKESIIDASKTEPDKFNALIACDYYRVWKIEVKKGFEFDMDINYMIMSVIDGEGSINGEKIKRGDHFIIPNGYGKTALKGDMTIIASSALV